jgi:multiple antibiotic resistance protein
LSQFNLFLNVFVGIFVIVDPFAMVPVYLSMTERFSNAERKQTRRRATTVASVILVLFSVAGTAIFAFFGITLAAFQIAGGILMLLLGIAQLNATRSRVRENETEEIMTKDDVSIFPLATPLLAGPGAISTAILYSSKGHGTMHMATNIGAIVAVMFVSHLILKFSPVVYKILGQTGLNVLTRVMGVILTAIAVQFIINGLQQALPMILGTAP